MRMTRIAALITAVIWLVLSFFRDSPVIQIYLCNAIVLYYLSSFAMALYERMPKDHGVWKLNSQEAVALMTLLNGPEEDVDLACEILQRFLDKQQRNVLD